MLQDELAIVAKLLRGQRSAALGTLADGAPFVSLVAYAPEPSFTGFLLHLSDLSVHTRQLRSDPRASLLVAEPDDGRDDVQTLSRISLVGTAAMIARDAHDYAAARTTYLKHLPAATMLFDFGDFNLYRFIPQSARYVGGFARAYTLTAEQLGLAR
jgi:putative heme iron utilization protein